MTDEDNFNPEDFYNKFVNGDPLTDYEVMRASMFFERLEKDLRQLGPVFKLSWDEVFRLKNRVDSICRARFKL
jgi:hypothetical protein